jgi:hypothetical protein
MAAETQADIQTIKTQSGQTLEGKSSILKQRFGGFFSDDIGLTYSEP